MIFSLLFLSSFDLFALFLTIISINILMYVLLISDDQTPRESIIKYFVLSTVSTLFFLGSVTLTLIFFKNTNFLIINQIIKYNILNVNISNSFALSEIT
jgi:NADH:ubiquinone oxidoreductase subunit 2 (subunit N)